MKNSTKLLGKRTRLFNIVLQVLSKVNRGTSLAGLSAIIIKQIKLLAALVMHTTTGRYQGMSGGSLVIVIAVLLYFLAPIDLIPDILPGVGYLDDITLIGWLFNTLSKELDIFDVWLKAYRRTEELDFEEVEVT